jgi:hypothetical protein
MSDWMGTSGIESVHAVPLRQVRKVITDLAGYSRRTPLATTLPGPLWVGCSLAALTGKRRLRCCDARGITGRAAPGEARRGASRLVKVGRLRPGWTQADVSSIAGGDRRRLPWRKNIVGTQNRPGRFPVALTDRANGGLDIENNDLPAGAMRSSGQPASGRG